MSRFFVSGYNSESSSEEEDLLSSSEEEILSEESTDSEFDNDSDSDSDSDSDTAPTGPSYFLKKSFLKGGDSDSDSEGEGRKVVKSAKEKLMDDIRDSTEAINVAKRTNQWTTVVTEFDKLGRSLVRAAQQNFGIPNFYIKCLGGLEDYINATLENEKSEKSLDAIESRAFNSIRQRVKKQIKEYQPYYDLFREQPELFDTEEPVDIKSQIANDAEDDQYNANRVLSPVFTTLKQISETRGKKNIDKSEQIQTLETLLEESLSKGSTFELISIYRMLLSIRFDASSNQSFMPLDAWKRQEVDLNSLLDLLEKEIKNYQLSELGQTTDDIDIEPKANEDGVKVVSGSITSLVDRLDDEFTKSLQNTDPHSIEYVERLKDEGIIYKLLVRGQTYVENVTPENVRLTTEQLPRIVLTRLEHVYYKPDILIKSNEADAWTGIKDDSSLVAKNSSPQELIDGLSSYLSSHTNKIYGKHALLLSIYYYAVNGNYAKARDLFLNSQIYNGINHFDSTLQVQYNRALVQLGLSAFRSGFIEESHKVLNEIVNSQRSKELLGQGFNSKYPNQASVVEKQKLLPFHQHINLELLECVHSTCSLLIEIPALAAAASSSSKDNKRKANIKSFKSKLEFHDRQFFTGPPESIKDHIVHASIALQKGDWVKAYELLSSIKIWKLFPNTAELLAMMKTQLQVEGLRTYIFTYRSIYAKLSIAKLTKVFDLANEKVIEILDSILESGEVNGSFDESKKFINFTSSEPQRSRLQELAIVMNEKVGLLTEKNEKTSSNGYGKKQPPQQQQQQQQQREQKDLIQEENNRFRYANVSVNNDEFQATA